ncbi:hypothetical protein U879_14395 [Defluviimonas sp. 20V17]|uniref:Tetratricopeptide repeat protein n=2 Tax=Allgaiera indica TaxID=765699 RepID=A0AAN4UQW7_9RHOB|nr:hypothetical protein U879_14395 [Defluviimonas sp. 20V17]GHE00770.1 hypothetical protein GCM10008024_13420 [Allgaiera indica]
MGTRGRYLNHILAAGILAMAFAGPATAQASAAEIARPDIPRLLKELKSSDPSIWRKAQSDLLRAWSSSGSSAMDLLLERGRKALGADNTDAAIDHLTALIDHAPDFAEGYNMRAMAYYEAGLFGPALADLGHALQLNPHQFGALAGLGMILEDSGFDKKALAAYKASAAIDPHQPSVNQAIARLTRKAEGEEI